MGERLRRAFDRSFKEGCDQVVAIGSDSPGLPLEFIKETFTALDTQPLVLGPALDGGYYLIGLSRPAPELFQNVPWSTAAVLSRTLEAADRLGLSRHFLPEYFDIDDPEDLRQYRGTGRVGAHSLKKISVIVPVKNEAAGLAEFLRDLKMPGPDEAEERGISTEIIVADAGSSDRTLEIARAHADAAFVAEGSGRSAQMRRGAEASTGDLLLFLHADTRLPADWRAILRRELWNHPSRPAAGAFRLAFDSPRWPYRWIERGAAIRNALTGVPQGDQALAVRRNAYFLAGGFPDVPLMEEYHFVPRLRKRGGIVTFSATVSTSPRRYEARGAFRNAFRNSAIVILHYLGASPHALARLYRSPALPMK